MTPRVMRCCLPCSRHCYLVGPGRQQCHAVVAGDVASLVSDMVESGLKPDAFTFAAILNACQRSNEAELAFSVFR